MKKFACLVLSFAISLVFVAESQATVFASSLAVRAVVQRVRVAPVIQRVQVQRVVVQKQVVQRVVAAQIVAPVVIPYARIVAPVTAYSYVAPAAIRTTGTGSLPTLRLERVIEKLDPATGRVIERITER